MNTLHNGHEVSDERPVGTAPTLPAADDAIPRELLRRVATSLKSLAGVVPYPEYASIVQRIARLRWQCESCDATDVMSAPPDQSAATSI